MKKARQKLADATVASPTFYYANTDANPPEATPGYPMTAYPDESSNVAPALVLWLILTTNPEWVALIDADGKINDEHVGSNSDIANQLGLTEGTVDYIFKIAQASPTPFTEVGNAFQTISKASQGAAWRFPCPPTTTEILKLAQAAVATNSVARKP